MIGKEKRKCSEEKNLPQSRLSHQKFHMNLPETEAGPPRNVTAWPVAQTSS
jgi:hypothetical protein